MVERWSTRATVDERRRAARARPEPGRHHPRPAPSSSSRRWTSSTSTSWSCPTTPCARACCSTRCQRRHGGAAAPPARPAPPQRRPPGRADGRRPRALAPTSPRWRSSCSTRPSRWHDLGDDARELLEAAALLANVGLFVSHGKHHKHSYYVIRNSDHLTGFTDHEIELIALVARYHRKSAPEAQARRVRRASDPADQDAGARPWPASCGWPSASTAPTPGWSTAVRSPPARQGRWSIEAVARDRTPTCRSSCTPPTSARTCSRRSSVAPSGSRPSTPCPPTASTTRSLSRPDGAGVSRPAAPRPARVDQHGDEDVGVGGAHPVVAGDRSARSRPGMASASRRWRCGGTTESCSVTTTAVGHVDRADPVPRREAGQRLARLDDHAGVVLRPPAGGPSARGRTGRSGRRADARRSSGAPGAGWPAPRSDATPAIDATARSPALPPPKLRLVAHSTSPSTRSGWRRHTSWAIGPPIE